MSKGPDEVYCQSCGETVKEYAEFCPNCGVEPGGSERESTGKTDHFCQSCGERVKAQAELCPNCGVRQRSNVATARQSQSVGESNDGSSDLVTYAASGFGIVLILAGIGTFGQGNVAVSFFQGVFYILLGAILLPPTRKRFDKEFPVTTVGSVRSVDESAIERTDKPCSACYDQITNGVARTYTERFVLFGVPLYVREEGRNEYCQTCANGEPTVNTVEAEVD